MYASDARHRFPRLQQKLQSLYTLDPGRAVALGFRAPYMDVLRALGDPQHSLPPVIHVAGTNGKGSVIAFLRSMLEAAGYRVHAYTSPHLARFNERIVLAGREIDDAALETLLDEVLAANAGGACTFFEITTTLAFAAFAREPADVLLLEVGMGGRLDCTNVIGPERNTILCSAITSLSLDHTEFLGPTLAHIAAEKAGIMKRGVPCVISPQASPEVMAVLEAQAQEAGASLARAGSEWFIDPQTPGAAPVFRFPGKSADGYGDVSPGALGIKGLHQMQNAATSLAVLRLCDPKLHVSKSESAQGLAQARWPGRLQNVTDLCRSMTRTAPLEDLNGFEVWLDGAHNAGGAEALAAQAQFWRQNDPKPLHLVLGMLRQKSPVEFISALKNHLDSVTCIGIAGEPKAFTAEELHDSVSGIMIRQDGSAIRLRACADIESALTAITETAGPARILIAGSLYLAGHVLQDRLQA